MPICCLVSVIVAYLGYCYDWTEFALTAFRTNCTGTIDSSWIHKITSFHYQNWIGMFSPFSLLADRKGTIACAIPRMSWSEQQTFVVNMVSIDLTRRRNSSTTKGYRRFWYWLGQRGIFLWRVSQSTSKTPITSQKHQ